ncbi:MAG: ferritin family protein [Leptospiraceae bacterium]|nr:ferritin family protein [Leptospiraceae bacterium]
MARFQPVKKTTFLEAVAAAIQHEKEVFDFYLKTAENLAPGRVKDLFFQLAEDASDHIKFIEDLYSQVEHGQALPNLKMLSEVHKFHNTSLQLLMRRVDRNTLQEPGKSELDALSLAMREHKDAAEFYEKISGKFEDPNIRNLFTRLSHFQSECMLLMESCAALEAQSSPAGNPESYWEAE